MPHVNVKACGLAPQQRACLLEQSRGYSVQAQQVNMRGG
jgi:hypothetical protein